jgi:phosphate starvation-inducible PhoH-like protein
MPEATVDLTHHDEARALFGPRDENLRQLCAFTGAQIVLRGHQLRITGDEDQVRLCLETLQSWRGILQQQRELSAGDVARTIPAGNSSAELTGNSPASSAHGSVFMLHSEQASSSSPNTSSTMLPAAEWNSGNRPLPEMRSGRDRVGQIRARTPGQQEYMDAIRRNELVICDGPAGSGKTYLAVALALECLRLEQVRKIVLVRPAVEAGEKLGFLPGDMIAKVNPYLRPLLDAIHDMLEHEQVRRYMANDVIEIAPLAFMRGRTLNDTFMILDEAQNTTCMQMRMFLTRMGANSRIVVTGDCTQSDLEKGTASGLKDAIRRLSRIPGVAIARLTGHDIVRHRLVREIVSAYETGSAATSEQEPA